MIENENPGSEKVADPAVEKELEGVPEEFLDKGADEVRTLQAIADGQRDSHIGVAQPRSADAPPLQHRRFRGWGDRRQGWFECAGSQGVLRGGWGGQESRQPTDTGDQGQMHRESSRLSPPSLVRSHQACKLVM